MATAFQNAITAGLAAAGKVAGLTVTYTTTAGSVVLDGTALRGQTDWEMETQDGLAERWESVDWLLPVADLVISSATVTPATGDTVSQTLDGITYIYTVCAPPGAPVYAYLDRGTRTRYRVHAKLTSQT